jgi:hypothetical protein
VDYRRTLESLVAGGNKERRKDCVSLCKDGKGGAGAGGEKKEGTYAGR